MMTDYQASKLCMDAQLAIKPLADDRDITSLKLIKEYLDTKIAAVAKDMEDK